MYRSIRTITLTMILLLGVIVIVVSVLYSGQVVKPMKEVAGSIAKITEGDFADTMSLHGYAEAEKISEDFNSMLSGLQNLEDARQ